MADSDTTNSVAHEILIRDATALAIRRACNREDVSFVLADIILDPVAALIKYRRRDFMQGDKAP